MHTPFLSAYTVDREGIFLKKPAFWAIAGAVFVMITGTLLHFTYEWFGGNFWASVGAVNESTWEHLKLLFFPMLAWTVIEYLVFGADTPGYLPIRAGSVLLGMLSIVVIFYTYSGVLGFNVAAVDIGSFFVSVALAFFFSWKKLQNPPAWSTGMWSGILAAVVLILLAAAFVAWTRTPPELAVFVDPVTGRAGL